MKKNRMMCLVFAVILALTATQTAWAAETGSSVIQSTSVEQTASKLWDKERYAKYLSTHSGEYGADQVVLTSEQITDRSTEDTALLDTYEGVSGALLRTEGTASVTYTFDIASEGFYAVQASYYAEDDGSGKLNRQLLVDNELPFREAVSLSLDRMYGNKDGVYYKLDAQGNQIRNDAIELFGWQSSYLKDPTGISSEPLRFYFTKGTHTLTLSEGEGTAVFETITLSAPPEQKPYTDYLQEEKAKHGEPVETQKSLKLQAEDMDSRSSETIYGTSDRSSANTEPYSSKETLISYLSGDHFSASNDWVTYRFEVEEAGYYKLSLKCKQNNTNGGFSTRRLYLNGTVPFQEMNQLRFENIDQWTSFVLGGEDTPYLFYLDKGWNTLTLEATTGEMSELIGICQTIVDDLNQAYRELFIVTGPEPDPFRDYNFDEIAKEELAILEENGDKLSELIDSITRLTGETGSFVSAPQRLVVDIEQMTKDPDSIAQRLNSFVTNLGSLSEWMLALQAQPLDLDYIEILPMGQAPSKAGAGFFKNLWHHICLFLDSFMSEYEAVADGEEQDAIVVWLGATGRDQSTLVKQMIDEEFVPETGIPVKMQFVTGALLPSTLAGIGPDVYMFAPSSDPINYAIRGAVQELNDFDGFEEVMSRFSQASLAPYTYREKTYAVPETEQFPMLFYRKDILDDFNVDVPNTWEEMYDVLTMLQSKNMSLAMLFDMTGYYMFLYQHGGEVFLDDGESVAFDNPLGIDAFKQWTNFFTNYKLSTSYSFVNRFRTGEMPIGIADFTLANQLNVSAPEIRGLWGMAELPGIMQEDGTINRSAAITSTGNIIMKQSDNKEAAWRFLSWWSEKDTQTEYAKQLESTMGIAARYATANKEAFDTLEWEKEDLNAIQKQREHVVGIPEVPGSYIVSRYINFAFSGVVDEGLDPGKQLLDYTQKMNAELTRKRKEFDLTVQKGE